MNKYKFTVRAKPSGLTSAEYKEAYKLETEYDQSLNGFKKFYGVVWLLILLITVSYTFFSTRVSSLAAVSTGVCILVESFILCLIIFITGSGFVKVVKDASALSEYYKQHLTIMPQWYKNSASAKGHTRRMLYLVTRILGLMAAALVVSVLTPKNIYGQNLGCVIIVGIAVTAFFLICLLWFSIGKKPTSLT